MACLCYYNPSLIAYTLNSQNLDAGDTVSFNINKLLTGKAISHVAGTPTVTIAKAGIYFISLDMDFEPTAAGNVTVQIDNNGVAIPDAITTFSGTVGDITHIHLDTLIRVLPSCCAIDNTTNLTVTVGEAGAVTNAKIIVL